MPAAIDLIRQSRPATLDVSLRQSTTTPGKLTFNWGPDGDLAFDDSAGYQVLMSVIAHKGMYRADRAYGTLLHRVRRSRTTTGSQLAAYARDGLAQVEASETIATGSTARAERVRSGRWRLRISWTANGKARVQEIEV